MRGKRAKKKPVRGQGPKPDMNVTPLVDIVLVLLIIFMVVTPALAQGETIQLPEVLRIDKLAKDVDPIKVIVSANGSLLLNGKKVDRAELEEKLRKLHAADPNRAVLLNTDVKLKYVRVREMLALMQNIGFKGVSLKVAPRKAE